MKVLFSLLLMLVASFSQEKTLVMESYTPAGINKTSVFIGENYIANKSVQRESIYFANDDKIYQVNHQKKELVPLDIASSLAMVKQQTAMLGEMSVEKTDKKKTIKGISTTVYKLSNKNSAVVLTGKLYIGYIKELADPKFKLAVDFQRQSLPVLEKFAAGELPLKLIMSMDMGQGTPMDIESKVIKIEDKIVDDDKDYVEKIMKYTKKKK